MITSPDEQCAISNLGWVDHGSIWTWRVDNPRPSFITLSDAKWLDVLAGPGEHFAAVHHWDGEKVQVTVHSFTNPEVTLASVSVEGSKRTSNGDVSIWNEVPSVFRCFLGDSAPRDSGYFVLQIHEGVTSIRRLDWFDRDHFDLDYQSVCSLLVLKESNEVLVGIQRSSTLYICEPIDFSITRTITLPGRSGNPSPIHSRDDRSIWTVDYDTLVRLDQSDWEFQHAVQLQQNVDGEGRFVGRIWLPSNEDSIAVPRPYSGDVLIIDPIDLTTRIRVDVDGQPFDAAVMQDGTLVCRDWKSGDTIATPIGL
jgi:hypothetical protein